MSDFRHRGAHYGALSYLGANYWKIAIGKGLKLAEESSSEENSEALEVVATEETLPEERPKVDHSKLYVWIADSGNDRIQKFDGNGKLLM